RPNVIMLTAVSGAAWPGRIKTTAYLGDHIEYEVETGQGNGRRLTLDPNRTMTNSLIGIGSNHHADPAEVGGVVEKPLGQGGNFFRNDSDAMMLAYVAAGRLAGYYGPSMNAWDCLGGYCLIAEA